MPWPAEYQRASDHFYDFLMDVKQETELGSTHMAYTTAQGVLQCFRRRLSLADAIRFSGVLPVGLRALFVADWDPDEATKEFGQAEEMIAEVQALRAQHNFAPADAIAGVARALAKHVEREHFDAILGKLPAGAREFWQS